LRDYKGSIFFVPQDLAILSPEKTILTYRLASVGSRVLAHLLDIALVFTIEVILLTIAGFAAALSGGAVSDIVGLILGVVAFFIPFLYFILSEGLWNGQTIGKKAANLRVRMSDGTPLTFSAAIARNLLRPADIFPGTYFVGIITMFVNPRSQRIGDMFANTIVVHERRPEPIFAPAPHIIGYHPLETEVGELRGMTMEEYVVLKRLCDRYPELPTRVQSQMMREVWEPIAHRYGIPKLPNVHPIYMAEATVMHFGRTHGLL
jgi:uncharacterized RDD family membrane protein YckC